MTINHINQINHIRHHRLLAAALLLAGLLGVGPLQAQTSFESLATARALHTDPNVQDPFTDDAYISRQGPSFQGRIDARADSDHQAPVYNGFAHAWSQVDVAGVHVYSFSQAVAGGTGPVNTNSQANASGFFVDHFALSVPGAAAGALFTVTAQLRSHGLIYAVTTPGWTGAFQQNRADAVTSWQSWTRVISSGGSNLAEVRAGQDCVERTAFGTPGCQDSGSIGLTTVSFVMASGGDGVELDMRAWASATSSVNLVTGMVQAEGVADLSNTVAWAGVLSLQDAGGAAVTDYTLRSSTSGFDYRSAYVSAVPEPASVVLWLGGLALLGAALRRRTAH